MKKFYLLFLILGLAACEGRVESPMELVMTTTMDDTYDFCIKTNGNEKYCDCEIAELEKTFPWTEYMKAVDVLAKEENHIAKVIAKHDGNRAKILEELNCDTCYFTVALGAVNVSPSPKCVEMLMTE